MKACPYSTHYGHQDVDSQLWARSPIGARPEGRAAAAETCLRRGKSGLHGTAVPGNARRVAIASAKAAQGQCHRKHTARLRTGKVERVRQERTAVLATGPAG